VRAGRFVKHLERKVPLLLRCQEHRGKHPPNRSSEENVLWLPECLPVLECCTLAFIQGSRRSHRVSKWVGGARSGARPEGTPVAYQRTVP